MAIEIAPPSTAAEKQKAIEQAMANISKQHGAGTLIQMKNAKPVPVKAIATGMYEVDYNVLGVGGLPRGRIVEVFGPESSGKTTLTLQVIAEAQRRGGLAAFIDVEHALDPSWAGKLGVNVGDLFVSQPDYGEQAIDVVQQCVETNAFDVIVVDSVAALVPKVELEGDITDANVGIQARLMSKAMRMLTGKVSKSDCILIFINQIREKIGVMFGSPETTTGGRALKFFSSVRLDIRRIGQVKEGDVIVGNKTKIKCVKNKVSAPFREAEVELLYEEGFDRYGSLLEAAVKAGVVEKNGSWFNYGAERIGQGRANAIATLKAADLYDEILDQVRATENSHVAA